MGTKRKNQTGYSQDRDSLGRVTWKKDPNAASSGVSNLSAGGEIIQDDGLGDVSSEEIKEYLFDMDKEERDLPEYDEVRNQLYRASKKESGSPDRTTANDVAGGLAEPDSGATVDMLKGTSVDSGFAYSPYPERSKGVHVSELTGDDINNYVQQNMDILSQEGNYLGVWHDPSDGTVYLDISVVSDDAYQARKGCEDNDQIAFFDMQTFESVTVNSQATSGGASQAA